MAADAESFNCQSVLGSEATAALARATGFLQEHSTEELLKLVGKTIDSLALPPPAAEERSFPAAYRGGKPCNHDLPTGRGMFYITQ